MAVVLLSALLWSFVLRPRLASRAGGPGEGREGRIAFFAFMGYFWSLVDDGPVNFDSVSTWPEVTSGLHHTVTEVILHVLTAAFMYLAVREAVAGRRITTARRLIGVSVLAVAAFWAAYFQNTPLEAVQLLMRTAWYQLDFVEHAVSVLLLYLAIVGAAAYALSERGLAGEARPVI
jgi:hypothetical protein